MSTITKERLEPVIERLEHYATNVKWTNVQAAQDMLIAVDAMRRLLASLEAEPVAWRNKDSGHCGTVHIQGKSPIDCGYEPLYLAPPAPVSVPDAMEMDDDFDSAFEHGKAVGWNAYRAAMLQSFGNSEQLNSPVIPDGWVLVPEEPTHEMLEAGDEQFGTYDVYRRMIAAAPQQEVK
ncbi:TPA: hypothetical protein LZ302_004866 [Enterobacter hormaechei subsp. xiangfangensis]|uniref:Eaa protein n=1 Tax=Enterobacter hormaechei TaxID=158836 RepID=A0AAE8X0B1_9ENTR|nr:hypothetical protein [Enterobacter hormaechei]TYS06775.1 hypothetical protein FZC81_21245 [Enterobacter hormaechei]HBM7627597.1 hypothetical protein [Enterobacter hormaechei subsp. xiangfangensis]